VKFGAWHPCATRQYFLRYTSNWSSGPGIKLFPLIPCSFLRAKSQGPARFVPIKPRKAAKRPSPACGQCFPACWGFSAACWGFSAACWESFPACWQCSPACWGFPPACGQCSPAGRLPGFGPHLRPAPGYTLPKKGAWHPCVTHLAYQ
jgi:hypothetical protein